MTDLEREVQQHLDADPHYPLGEPDAMKWAVAFRLIGEREGCQFGDIDDELMVGWFANCMATGELQATGGSFLNADGMQSVIDGEMESHPEFNR